MVRSFVVWSCLPLALACSFDATGIDTALPATNQSNVSGVDDTTSAGMDTTGEPTTGAGGLTAMAEPSVTETGEPLTTGPSETSTTGSLTTGPLTTGPETTDTSTTSMESGDVSTTEPGTTQPETTGPEPCEAKFIKEIALAANANIGAPMQTQMSNQGEGIVAFSEVKDQGTVSFTLNVECPGEVAVWGRVLDANPGINNADPDSYYVRVDNGADVGWFYGCQTMEQQPGYRWLRITSAIANQDCATADKFSPNLPAGGHTFHLRNREAMNNDLEVAAIARLLVTNDMTYVPIATD